MKSITEPQNRRILVIDDNEAIHGDFHKILGNQEARESGLDELMLAVLGETEEAPQADGYALASAYQGQDGLALVQEALGAGTPYALAFVDIRMPPGWDGIKTIQHLWQSDPHLEIVICTAYSDYGWEEIQKQLGRTDHFMILKKPFDTIEVRQIASALTQKWTYARQARYVMDELNSKIEERTRELRQSNELLTEANKRIQENQNLLIHSEKMASIGILAAGVAHEINNPIGFVMSNLNTMQQYVATFTRLLNLDEMLYSTIRENDAQNMHKILEALHHIRKEENIAELLLDAESLLSESYDGTKRIRDIVQNLKCFARIDEAELKDANLNDCIETTLKVVWNELKYKCTVRKNLQPLPPLRCYPQQLNQVFMNLLVNAAQAIPERGEITLATKIVADSIVIICHDTGTGIPPENLPKLFDPFFTTKPVGKGTGLGLSISHGIIEKHNGTIDVESTVGQGTTFTIHLPLPGIAPQSKNRERHVSRK